MNTPDKKKQIFQYSLVSLLFFFIFPPLAIAPLLMLFYNIGAIKGVIYNVLYIVIVFSIVFIFETIKKPYNISGNAFELFINLLIYFIFVSLIAFYINFILKFNKDFFLQIILISIPYIIISLIFILYQIKTGFSFFTFSQTLEIFKDFKEFSEIAKQIDYFIKFLFPKFFIPISLFIAFIIEQHFSFYLKTNNVEHTLQEIDKIFLNKIFLYITIAALYIFILIQFILKLDNKLLLIFIYTIVFSFIIIYSIYGYSFITYYLKKSIYIKFISNSVFLIFFSIILLFYGIYLIPILLVIFFFAGIIDHSFNIKKI